VSVKAVRYDNATSFKKWRQSNAPRDENGGTTKTHCRKKADKLEKGQEVDEI